MATDHLYVVGENENSTVVKIGRSGQPLTRLTGIQTGYPRKLRVLHVEDGAGHLEDDVHKALAVRRAAGEWFDFGEDAALETVRQVIADVKAIQEIAARHALVVNLVTTHRPLKMAKPLDELPEAEAPAQREKRPTVPHVPPKPRDPCEHQALMQVNDAAVRGFFAMHPNPTAHLRSLGIPAHHIEWWYRELSDYGMKPDAALMAEAQRERAAPESFAARRAPGSVPCRLNEATATVA